MFWKVILTILLLCTTLVWVSKRYKTIVLLLFSTSLFAKILVYLAHRNYFPNFYTSRLYNFEKEGYKISQGGITYTLGNFTLGADFYSWIIGILYNLIPRSDYIISLVNIIFTTLAALFAYKIVVLLSKSNLSRRTGVLVMSVLCFSPSIVFQSVVISREPITYFSLTGGFMLLAYYYETKRRRSLLYGLILLGVAGSLHSGTLICLFLTFFTYLIYVSGFYFKKFLKHGNVKFVFLASTIILTVASIYLITTRNTGLIRGTKLLNFLESGEGVYYVSELATDFTKGSGAYPSWLSPSSIVYLLLLSPLRITYFLFSPLPWDIVNFRQLAGSVSSVYFLVSIYIIYRRFSFINLNSFLIFATTFIFFFVLVFSLAVSNYGQSFRHRLKILFLIASLAGVLYAHK